MSRSAKILPLFPLNIVLFPNEVIPLQIFEPRYRLMIQTCLAGDSDFGVVLIKSGTETGEPAEPYRIGTSAKILETNNLKDGRIFISVRGTERFVIERITNQKPYIEAYVSQLRDHDCEPQISNDILISVREAAIKHVRLNMGLNGEWVRSLDLSWDPTQLSYAVASLTKFAPSVKQQLLEEKSAVARLKNELDLLVSSENQLKTRVSNQLNQRISKQ